MKRTVLSATALCLYLCLCSLAMAQAQDQEKPPAADKPAPSVKAQDQEKPPAAEKPGEPVEIKAGKEKGKQVRFFAYPQAQVKEAVIDAMKAVEYVKAEGVRWTESESRPQPDPND